MAEDKISGKVGLDTTDFKTGITAMNRELRVLESGFRASAASLGDWSSTATGLEARIKTLNSAMDIQKQKVAATRTEWERVKAEKGEDSIAAQNLEIKLNKETETLGKMQSELNETQTSLSGMTKKTEDAGQAAQETGQKWGGFKLNLSGIKDLAKGVAVALAGLATAVAGVGAAIVGMVLKGGEAAGALVDLSLQTGISTTRLQELQYAGSQIGTSLDTITGSMAKMIRSMYAAKDGTGEQATAFEALGVSVTNSDGSLRNSETVFANLLDALNAVENPAERDALAMQIFGKSAQELNPLIKAGSAELAKLSDQAHQTGAVMSESTVSGLEEFDDGLDAMKLSLTGLLGSLASAFLPGFQGVLGQVGGYLKQFTDIISTSNGDFTLLSSGIGRMVKFIAMDIAKQAPAMLEAGLALVTSLLNSFVSLLPTLIPLGVETVLTLVNAIVPMLPLLIEAGMQALTMLIDGLAQAAPELVPVIVMAIGMILKVLWDNAPALLQAGWDLIVALGQGLANAVPQEAMTAAEDFIGALLVSLILFGAQLWQGAFGIVLKLVQGVQQNLVLVRGIGEKIMETIKNAIAAFVPNITQMGKNIVEGVWQGIKNSADWFYNRIYAFFKEMVKAAMEALGIQSPSKVFMRIGRHTIQGFGMGFAEQFRSVESALVRSMAGLESSLMPLPASSGMASGTSIGPFYAPVVVQGPQTPESLGAALRAKRF